MLFPSVKWRFGRTAELKNVFHPVKGHFAGWENSPNDVSSGERQVCPDENG